MRRWLVLELPDDGVTSVGSSTPDALDVEAPVTGPIGATTLSTEGARANWMDDRPTGELVLGGHTMGWPWTSASAFTVASSGLTAAQHDGSKLVPHKERHITQLVMNSRVESRYNHRPRPARGRG